MAGFYLWWYPSRWFGWGRWPRYAEFGDLAGHMRFAKRNAAKLAREVFHGMLVHGAKLQNKQGFLFRLVDIGIALFAMAATVSRAHAMTLEGSSEAANARRLADLYCRNTRREIGRLFHDLWRNDDVVKYRTALTVLEGQAWTEAGIPTHEEITSALQQWIGQVTGGRDATSDGPGTTDREFHTS
jgi:hypothetical protein